jgi:broad specificity phosphatase PhoE
VSDHPGAELALSKIDSLRALDLLRDTEKAALGGDVYRVEENRMRPTHDNWYVKREEGESTIAFAERSRSVAEQYIRQYLDPEDGSIAYVLVVR